MRKHIRRIYQRSIAVTKRQTFFNGFWIVGPGVYPRPLGRLPKPDRVCASNDLHLGA